MAINEREYMQRDFDTCEDEGVFAENKEHAERLLSFCCPTQAANGKWYRTTLAVTNVPVFELYNILSAANGAARRLHELASQIGGELGKAVDHEARNIIELRDLLKRGEGGGKSPWK